MIPPSTAPVLNRIINNLPYKQRVQIMAQCMHVQLSFGEILSKYGTNVTHVYFPLTGFISLVSTVDSRQPIEMGMIGNEGMMGATLALGVNKAPLQAVVQGPGSALMMTAARFRRLIRENSAFHHSIDHYLFVLIEQLAQTAACNCFHDVHARLARWFLMTHDRAHGSDFHLTHQFLADMLGVRRSAVTIAAGKMQDERIIHYTRGLISVLSRRRLEAASCECYAMSVSAYNRLMPAAAHGRDVKSGPVRSAQS